MATIEFIPIKDLVLTKNNPRKIGKSEFEDLCKSIEKDPGFFTNRPVLVNRICEVLNVYAGNQRIRAAKKLGWKEVPCIIDENLSDEVINERIIKDNRHAGSWDYDILANLFDIEMLMDCGFTAEEFQIDTASDKEDKEEGEKKKKTCPSCGHEF